jgi:hypothetical protein
MTVTYDPKLVGVERSVELRIGDRVVRARPEDAHAEQLTREDITASVHYVWFDLDDADVAGITAGPVTLAIEHPSYRHATTLLDDTVAELVADSPH